MKKQFIKNNVKTFNFQLVTFYFFIFSLCVLMITGPLSCSPAENNKPVLRVAASGNLSFMLKDLQKPFHKANPGVSLQFITASSGKLTMQIENGAAFDIFLSADMAFPERLFQKGLAAWAPVEYARGVLILFTRTGFSPGEGLDLLKRKNLSRIAIASRKLAPYGRAAFEVLDKIRLLHVSDKLVIAPNIMQAAQYVLHGADAGFIARSALSSPAMKKWDRQGLYWIPVDRKLYRPISQGMVLLKGKEKNEYAEKFYRYMLSSEAKKVMKRYGYN